MRKIHEKERLDSCFNRAKNTEMLFVLLARDPAVSQTILFWVSERIRLGQNTLADDKIQQALECAKICEIQNRSGAWEF
jgi:hypothetical protein